MSRRQALAAAAGLALAGASGARAQGGPIRLIVPFTSGTGSDAIARMLATELTGRIPQPVVVENRGGAGGITGTEQGARATPDGQTLTLGTNSTLVVNPLLNPRVQYKVEQDFVPIAGLARTYYAVVTANNAEAPADFAALTRRLKAGGATYGSSGVGTITHLASEIMVQRMGGQAMHVPYRGSGQVQADLMGGQILFSCDTMAAVLPLIRSGGLRALAVTSPQRLAALPEVPTLVESGLDGLVVEAWYGLMAPAGTPARVTEGLTRAVLDALQSPEMRARLQPLEFEVLAMPPAAFSVLIRDASRFWAEVVRQTGVRIES
ncbi:tripartite tricarboxylate transporter substrate binding protein [Roseomonas sp. OT10]|uniref:Bug family tripartite tricarboxylate transporter substrate binding protein n=1 Tax=Roseomonas cutis TaxID=2897332 RepID=UPI001E2D1C81|nr:tripartite tricarboxylate transporter substrate binding protein [Roseomonas sp. OT10]UFN47113.1 tripartite tricarboxylate transporter substrate binding protein [Roseomonas sp. OT10]